jgi:CRISPR-associated protein Cst2
MPNASHPNLFATVLTYAAPSSNYRGESEENRTVLQKITKNGTEYTVISPESMRNALREILHLWACRCNRRRLDNEEQLAVEFKEHPARREVRRRLPVRLPRCGREEHAEDRPAKRDSVLRMNMAVALTPYRFDATFHQSPMNAGESPWKNSPKSALLHREVAHTAYQYPFALSLGTCAVQGRAPAGRARSSGRSASCRNVAGGHARSYFEMAPRSVVARLPPQLVAGFDTYGFNDRGGSRS